MFVFKNFRFFSFVLLVSICTGCSFHFREGQELEKKNRIEEAAIEYRLAFVEDPDDEEIRTSLKRTNTKVAEENFQRYLEYLRKKDYKKAYRRLASAAIQNPTSTKIQSEQAHWLKVLVAGKIKLQFDRLQANIRLADEMQLQILLNTPTGKTLTANISNETGIFFAEDLLYKQNLKNLPYYSINAIGLKLKRITLDRRTKEEFKKFINFRGLLPEQPIGNLKIEATAPIRTVQKHRTELQNLRLSPSTPWFPPRLIRYHLVLSGSEILVATPERIEFMPDILYLNHAQKRAFVDFGVYQLSLDPQTRIWNIQKPPYLSQADDYFHQFSQNLALYPYFFYRDGVYRYSIKK